MAILSAILSLLSKKVGDLLQAIFGWSIAGLFGRLPSKKQNGVAVALFLSITWPLLLVGIAAPGVASWAVAFVPLHDFVSRRVLRIVWTTLAVLTPIIVAVITRWVAPPTQKKNGLIAVLVSSVPLTLGFAISFFITACIVPTLKLASMARKWSDDHVYVLIDQGAYGAALDAVRSACLTANVELDERPVPRFMAFPLRVLKWFARGALAPLLAEDPRMLHTDDLEIYLYPADLLLRGTPSKVARVRTVLVTQMLHAPVHLVEDSAGQKLEDEIHRLWKTLDGPAPAPAALGAAEEQVRKLAQALSRADLPLDQWTLLHTNLTLLEHALSGGPYLVDPEADPSRERAAGRTVAARRDTHPSFPPDCSDQLADLRALDRQHADQARCRSEATSAR